MSPSTTGTTTRKKSTDVNLVIATRLHLGNATNPPTKEKIQKWIQNLIEMSKISTYKDDAATVLADDTRTKATTTINKTEDSHHPVLIAVDSTPKMPNYDLVQAIQKVVDEMTVMNDNTNNVNSSGDDAHIIVLPVTPWGKFVPALNALIQYVSTEIQAKYIMFVSAEVSASPNTIQTLLEHCGEGEDSQKVENDEKSKGYVLCAGAALAGHEYAIPSSSSKSKSNTVILTGRTCPWNTLCIWNLSKLQITGFLSISDLGQNAGIEECVAIAIHQQFFPQARAKLVHCPDVSWDTQCLQDDPERQAWHDRKMLSKLERAHAQLSILNLVDQGRVEFC